MEDEACEGEPLTGANVATVPQRSPFRYPGGKTWLIEHVRRWLEHRGGEDAHLIEPFAGGAVVALTAVCEDLVGAATLVERDRRVADVWRAILGRSGRTLARQIRRFEFSEDNVRAALAVEEPNLRERAFRTLLRNRTNRNGVIAEGAGTIRKGEYGLGRRSRWYPATLSRRILDIVAVKDRLAISDNRDGRRYLSKVRDREDAVFFIDPPYPRVGRRLYRHADVRPETVFERASELQGDFLMTYKNTDEIRGLARAHQFAVRPIQMQGGQNTSKTELLIGRDLSWTRRNGHRA